MYIITAVVGVETWYKPLIWNVLYRDIFVVMILGESLVLTVVSTSLVCAFFNMIPLCSDITGQIYFLAKAKDLL